MEILERTIEDIPPNDRGVSACAAYFPFDKPAIIKTAVRNIRPKSPYVETITCLTHKPHFPIIA